MHKTEIFDAQTRIKNIFPIRTHLGKYIIKLTEILCMNQNLKIYSLVKIVRHCLSTKYFGFMHFESILRSNLASN